MILAAAGAIAVAAAQLASADISVSLGDRSAVVSARYHIRHAPGPVRFVLMRLRGQTAYLAEALPPGGVTGVRVARGLYEFTVTPADSHETIVSVRYEVTGALTRIPVLGPEAPTEPGSGAVRIRVAGVPETASLEHGFPRLAREADGTAVARLDNLPSLIRLPPARGSLHVNRISDISVVLLVALGLSFWLLRRRQPRLTPSVARE